MCYTIANEGKAKGFPRREHTMKAILVTTDRANSTTISLYHFESKKQAVECMTKTWGWKKMGLKDTFLGCQAGVVGYRDVIGHLFSEKDWEAFAKYAF